MMTSKDWMAEAKVLEPQLQQWRRTLHRNPEVGFDLPKTRALVKQALTEMGYTPQDCGKAGIIALAGGKRPGKTILLRGDMDALPIQEESGVDFASEVPGKMHGCGHDMHTAMMLGAAKLLKEHEEELEGTVKLEFQPAEEIFQGSPDMLANGLLENPKVDAAVMFHVIAGMPLPSGMVLVPHGGITMASCEQYHIVVHGKGGHGSMPEACIDPITAAAHIHIALQEINSREMDPHSFGVFTTGRFQAGAASNVIPDTAEMWGTIRTVDPENKVGELIHKRMTEIAQGVAAAYRRGQLQRLLPLHGGGRRPRRKRHDLYDRADGPRCAGHEQAHRRQTRRRQRGLRLRQPRGAHRQHVYCGGQRQGGLHLRPAPPQGQV